MCFKTLPIFSLQRDLCPNLYHVSEKLDGMSVQNYECVIDITSDTSFKRQFSQIPLVEFGAVIFKNICKCLNMQYLNLLFLPQLICRKLLFQGMWEQNLHIFTDWMLHSTWEFSQQSLPTLKDFMRQRNNIILQTSNLRGKIECILK